MSIGFAFESILPLKHPLMYLGGNYHSDNSSKAPAGGTTDGLFVGFQIDRAGR